MKCKKHGTREATAQCTECGAFVCEDCTQKSEWLRDSFGTLCPDCYVKQVTEMRDFYSERKGKMLGRVIGMAVTYVAGIICIFLTSQIGMPMLLIGILLCGIYGAITAWKFASDTLREDEWKNGATYVITDTGVHKETNTWLKVIFFIFGVAFGLFITPINIIRYIIKTRKEGNKVRFLEDALQEARA